VTPKKNRDKIEQAVRIDEAIDERGFALDLLVRTPKVIENRLRWGDWFIKEIMERGKVLYEKDHARVGPRSRKRLSRRSPTPQGPAARIST
jgi:hypothetical protein